MLPPCAVNVADLPAQIVALLTAMVALVAGITAIAVPVKHPDASLTVTVYVPVGTFVIAEVVSAVGVHV